MMGFFEIFGNFFGIFSGNEKSVIKIEKGGL
jgi:hypothetical protein